MENLNLYLFIAIAVPLGMMVPVFEGKSKRVLGFLLVGLFTALFAGELNGLLFRDGAEMSKTFYSVNVSPCIEEFLKSIPIFVFAFAFRPNTQMLAECSVAVGVGFAILENASVLAQTSGYLSFSVALIRGFGAGMMHGLASLIVGWGATLISKDRRLFITGTIALLNLATVFHSVYNALAKSPYQLAAFMLPTVIFIPLKVFGIRQKREKKKAETP